MTSPELQGGEQTAADFAAMQAAAVSLEVFALKHQGQAGEFSTAEILSAELRGSYGRAVLSFIPNDAELLVLSAEPKCLHTDVHSLLLREGEPYLYRKDARNIDIQAFPPPSTVLRGIQDIAADREARRIFLHMGDSVRIAGERTLIPLTRQLSKMAVWSMRHEWY